MDSKTLAGRGLAAIVVGAWLSASASAQQFTFEGCRVPVTFDTTCPAGQTGIVDMLPAFNESLFIPQFDGSLGELTRVRVDITMKLDSQLRATNTSSNTSDIMINNRVPVSLVNIRSGAQSVLPDFRFGDGFAEPKVELFNMVDFDRVPSGGSVESAVLTKVEEECLQAPGVAGCTFSASISEANDVFVGGGSLEFEFLVTSGECNAAGPASVIEDCDAFVSIDIKVTYETVNCPKIPRRRCASLLLFPEFDNRHGVRTVATVTNKNRDKEVCVHYLYIGRKGYDDRDLDCEEFDRHECLTPNDTLTLITNYHNPQQEQGFFYVYAINKNNHKPIIANDLIGHLLVVDGLETFEYAINPVDYRAILGPDDEPGDLTDKDGDGIRDLNGIEYEKTPCELLIPRFIGQNDRLESKLIFIGLTGGARFTTTADILLYNDNEQAFSANHTFRCWDKVRLVDISNAFKNDFLKTTDDDGQERLGHLEYGWMRITGRNAHSTFKDILDPAIYTVLIEVINKYAAADLPFERCNNKNGHLFPRTLSGDNEE